MTSVTPRRPVARRFRRRMPAADNSVMSMWDRAGARSQAKTCWATRTSLPRPPRLTPRGRRLPGRADAATGLRIIDAVVIHTAEHHEECRLHLLDLLQRQRRFVELAGVHLRLHDVIDGFLDFLRCQILEHAQRRLDRIGDDGDARLPPAGPGT